jgi:hypothetical protein
MVTHLKTIHHRLLFTASFALNLCKPSIAAALTLTVCPVHHLALETSIIRQLFSALSPKSLQFLFILVRPWRGGEETRLPEREMCEPSRLRFRPKSGVSVSQICQDESMSQRFNSISSFCATKADRAEQALHVTCPTTV